MTFKLRNNTEAITGFIQGMIMDYDYETPILKHFKALEIEVVFQAKSTEITLHTWVEDGNKMPIQTISIPADATTEWFHKEVLNTIELIHEDYIRFFKR